MGEGGERKREGEGKRGRGEGERTYSLIEKHSQFCIPTLMPRHYPLGY